MAAPRREKKQHQQQRKPKDEIKPRPKSFKKSAAPAAAPPPRSTAPPPRSTAPPPPLLLDDPEPDFPRGGKSLLTREERAEALAEADAEFEREESKQGKGKKRNKGLSSKAANTDAADGEMGSLFGEGVTGKLPRYANRITLKNISSRMKLWGVIVEVNSKDLVISLPGGLRGFVRAEEATDIILDNGNKDSDGHLLHSIFHVGQLVPSIVLRVDDDKQERKGNKRIWLSLRLSLLYKGLTLDAVQDGMVLIAQVKSVEDHGYILHFGVSSFTGFLPRSEKDGDICTGQLLQCIVKNIDKDRAVAYLNSDPDLVSKCVVKDLKGLSIDLLVPGMLVNARVHSTLENGIMLSFLTYFTGTVDIFHLQSSFPCGTWKDDYNQHKKVNARILFIDPSTRAIGLTLNDHLVRNKVTPLCIKTGDIYDMSRIIRVDKGAGLLLEIPSSPAPYPAYVSIFDAADEVLKLEKKFKEGGHVRVRILGTRHLEGLAVGTLKASAFEGSVFTHSDVKPGMLVKAKIIAVEDFGAIVQLSSGVKALCPLPHMSEFDIAKPAKKFKVGAELLFRVLGCKSKRITVTHKKTLVKSKLNVLASYADATEGLITHSWITKIEKHGCFVRFYNGVQGFAHRSELGLEPGCEPSTMYHVGQVVKCRIISSAPASRRINVSLVMSKKRVSEDTTTSVGSVISGVVDRLTPEAVIVRLSDHLKGTISNEHLSDHQGQAILLRSLLMPGYVFDQLLVLDNEGNGLVLSAKYSLVNSAQEMPSDIAQIQPLSVAHGYICNLIENGCFVRFLGRLTGFSPKNKATDVQIANLSDAFYLGQSVRSHIIDVNCEAGRIKLSLKQSLCFSTDVSFIMGYFLLEEKIAALQMSGTKNSDGSWVKSFSIGSVVEGEVQEINEFGVVLSFKNHDDIVGFIAHHQLGGINIESGTVVNAVVLDVAKSDGLIDLSLKPELVGSANMANELTTKKKRRRAASMDLELHQTVNAIVEIVKENYLVLSIPEHSYAIGYASITDYNTQKLCKKHFVNGQSILVAVGALPSAHSSGRLLLLVQSEVLKNSSSKRAKKKSSYSIGSRVEAEIIDIQPIQLLVKFGVGYRGRVHITEVIDDDHSLENPFSNFRIGQLIDARIIAQSGKSGKGHQWEMSVRPSVLSGTLGAMDIPITEEFSFSIGNSVRGYVVKVDHEWVWMTVSRHISAHIFVLDSSSDPAELQEFDKRFTLGQAVIGRIISMNKEKKLLRLAPYPPDHVGQLDHEICQDNQQSRVSNSSGVEHIVQGDIIGGRIKKILPGVGGLHVQIGPHLFGKVHYTELEDKWVPSPLSGYHEGQFVKCKVLEISRTSNEFVHVDLSLRSPMEGLKVSYSTENDDNMRLENIDGIKPNMVVQGYVKNVSSKGCFIMLSRTIDARILLSNLSNGYIENPEKEFPVGKLVQGRVLSVEPASKRVDVTLKTATEIQISKSDEVGFRNLRVGHIISGKIRRTEAYGLFISIDNTNMVGLCHISELSDDHLDNIETKYRAGDKVVAKILKVDEERHRISLGMKISYIGDVDGSHIISNNASDNEVDDNIANNDSTIASPQTDNLYTQSIFVQNENECTTNLTHAESRTSILPLQVSLGDSEVSDMENDIAVNQDNVKVNEIVSRKHERQLKKKAKEEREREISASEERSLQKDVPKTADEFEKLVRTSPNSSYVWINYMNFMVTLADIEKARSIAERALKTINIREEGEKFNIWVAYFNLEYEHGSPPEESVLKIFQRALQYCDPKKIHIALLGLYERTKQFRLADELIEKMTKKFRNSCKVWLRCVQNLLNQGKEGIQSVVNRALLSLPRRKHIKFISQAAILEYKCGVPDRGRSMFEGILREYPKRTDLWSVYLDQEIRNGDVDLIRALFERATCLSLPPKKMKFLYKKYLKFENSHDDEARVEHVKTKAREYVDSLLA